ncbi:hypothetical protein BHM03_00000044 [Ensete ventricosum]|uniref:Uncharacterized protein n=1 Tax=Ensete ventricosum TaxID=4639 RepID=A0A445M882_ENSVE|nr:hypothetical protein BHM03_00000044 [Ensete ventricosum]
MILPAGDDAGDHERRLLQPVPILTSLFVHRGSRRKIPATKGSAAIVDLIVESWNAGVGWEGGFTAGISGQGREVRKRASGVDGMCELFLCLLK